jgi:hypothetical protein
MRLKLLITILFLIPVVLAANVNLDELDIAKFTLSEDEEKTIQIKETDYSITADSVTANEIRLAFQPSNLALAIRAEQTIDNIDLNNDQEAEFSLTYISNVDKTATLELKKPGAESEVMEEEEEITQDTQLPDTQALSSALKQNLKFIIGGVVILIILILIFSRGKNNPEKLYVKAESLHREGQEFHEDGDQETALELYDKAEELREKARELEKSGE